MARSKTRTNNKKKEKDKGRRGGRRKVCFFCVNKVDEVDYKDTSLLRRYVNDKNKITARRSTGTCAKHQRRLSMAIKRAREMALLPYCLSR